MITHIAYKGWENNICLSNGQLEVVATLDVGPRLLRFAFKDNVNVLKEFSEQLGGVHETDWQIRGGHRLWHAPEAKPRTYALDNSPVRVEELNEYSIRLIPCVEVENGIQKQMDLRMEAESNQLTIVHQLTNVGPWTMQLAPWALSVMAPGGIAVMPLPEKRPHTEVLTPDFPLVLWPYTDLSDTRYHWGRRYITFAQNAEKGPSKIGLALSCGWAAYHMQHTLFVKYFDYLPEAHYPDGGCNFETFSNEEMLEVESIGPLTELEPGATVEHVETWRLFANVPDFTDEASIDQIVRKRVEG